MALLTSPTLQNLLTSVRTILRQRDPNNSTWLDDELSEYLNEAIRLYFLECTSVNEGYFTTQTGTMANPDLDIVSGVEGVALPVDCFQIKNVWKKVNDGWVILNYKNSLTESYSNIDGGNGESYFPGYTFQGNNLVFRPTPDFSEVGGIRLEYLQFPETMVYGGDAMTSQVSPIFKQLITMYAVYKAKLSESMTNGVDLFSVPKSNLDQLTQLFRDTIQKRSKNPTYVIAFNPETD